MCVSARRPLLQCNVHLHKHTCELMILQLVKFAWLFVPSVGASLSGLHLVFLAHDIWSLGSPIESQRLCISFDNPGLHMCVMKTLTVG